MLSMLTLNIQAASLRRAQALLAWLAAREDDVLVLTETSPGEGSAWLLNRFRTAGFEVVHTVNPGDRGTALVSRIALIARPELSARVSLPHRMVAASVLADPPVTLLGVYVPSSDRAPDKLAKKKVFVASLLQVVDKLPEVERARLVLTGDYNVITRDHQPRHPGFLPFEYELLDTLHGHGLLDAHACCWPGVQAHSWYGRAGAGYRFDYAHIGPDLADRLEGCDYLQHPRERQLTDHAALTVRLRVGPIQRLDVDRTALSDTGALF